MRCEATLSKSEAKLENIVLRLDEDRRWRVLDYYTQPQVEQSFEKELTQLKADSALVLVSQDIDAFPLWSPNSDYLVINLAEETGNRWYKVNLAAVTLFESKWRGGKKIGLLSPYSSSISLASNDEVKDCGKVSKLNPREVKTSYDVKIELKSLKDSLGTSLIITAKGKKSKTLWTTDLENCHSLSLSPDEKYVAFIAEQNGVVVMKIGSVQ